MSFPPQMKYLPSERFVIASLALLSAIIFLNLNGVAYLILGSEGFLSPLIAVLVFCTLVVGSQGAAFVTVRLGGWYIAFVMSYLLLGLMSGMFFGLRDLVPSVLWAGLTNILTVVSFYTGAYFLGRRNHLHYAVSFILVLMTIMAVLIVASPLYIDQLQNFNDVDADRSAGVFVNPNVASSFCCIGLVLALAQIRTVNARTITQVLLFVAAIATTFSKTGALALFIILVTFSILSLISKQQNRAVGKFVSVLTGLLLIIVISLIFEFDTVLDLSSEQERRMDAIRRIITSGAFDDETTTNRASLFQIALAQWEDSPLIGVGLGAMHLVDGSEWGVHNTFMLVLGEAGVFPFIFLVGLCITSVTWAWKNSGAWQGRVVLGYVIVFVASCLTSHNVLEDRFHNAMTGICIAIVVLFKVSGRQIYRDEDIG